MAFVSFNVSATFIEHNQIRKNSEVILGKILKECKYSPKFSSNFV